MRHLQKKIYQPTKLSFDVSIGIQCLLDNMDEDNTVRDIDLVWCVKHIAHEARHIYQQTDIYQKPLHGYFLDMARMDALSVYFYGYKQNTYSYLPSELDAEIHGMQDTVSYFNTLVEDKGNALIDAKACLYEKVKELPTNRIWYQREPVTCYEDMIISLERMKNLYLIKDRGFPLNKSNLQDNEYLEKCYKHHAWLDVLGAEYKIGVPYDRKLFAMAIDINPAWVKQHKGIQREAKEIQKEFPPQFTFMQAIKDLWGIDDQLTQ